MSFREGTEKGKKARVRLRRQFLSGATSLRIQQSLLAPRRQGRFAGEASTSQAAISEERRLCSQAKLLLPFDENEALSFFLLFLLLSSPPSSCIDSCGLFVLV